jgi:hypothetical protein
MPGSAAAGMAIDHAIVVRRTAIQIVLVTADWLFVGPSLCSISIFPLRLKMWLAPRQRV